VPWETVERDGTIILNGDDRNKLIPNEFVLVGTKIKIRQEQGGEITIYPASPEGIAAVAKFHPFSDWEDDG